MTNKYIYNWNAFNIGKYSFFNVKVTLDHPIHDISNNDKNVSLIDIVKYLRRNSL